MNHIMEKNGLPNTQQTKQTKSSDPTTQQHLARESWNITLTVVKLTKMIGWTAVRADAEAARMTMLRPDQRVVMSVEAASAD